MFDVPPPQEIVWMSDRENFWSPQLISKQTYMMSIDPIDFSHFQDKKVLFLMHGFNNTVEEAEKSYYVLSQKMGELKNADGTPLYDLVVNYFWPGYDRVDAYFDAEKNAQSPILTNRLANTLTRITQKATCIDVIAHSMGNRVLLETLSNIPTDNGPILRYFYSFAAAVNDDSIDQGGEYSDSLRHCKSVYIFHSDVDIALNGYEVAKDHPALGSDTDIDLTNAPANIQFIDCTLFLQGDHSAYFKPNAAPIFHFIENQQKTGNIASNPKQWVLQQDGSLKEGDVVLNWAQKCKALLVAATSRAAN